MPALITFCAAILVVTLLGGLSTHLRRQADADRRLRPGRRRRAGRVVVADHRPAGRLHRRPRTRRSSSELVRRSERLARENLAAEPDETEFLELDPRNPRDFEELVREALDDLPDLLLQALDHVAVVISDKGRRHRAYGLYQGDTAARDDYPDRIIIFRDTLLRDFGHDPDELRAQVTRTVRHELAHHLGADELGVRELGL